jgi:hypothetical protein
MAASNGGDTISRTPPVADTRPALPAVHLSICTLARALHLDCRAVDQQGITESLRSLYCSKNACTLDT